MRTPDRQAPASVPAPADAADGRWVPPPMTAGAWLRFDTAWPRVVALRPRRILEIGPGVAGFGARAAAACEAYVGVERSDDSREVAERRLAEVPGADAAVVADLDDVPAEARFDLVCAFEVLEHIEDDRSALDSWVGRTEPGGSVIISVPAHAGRFGAGDEAVGHFRRYDPEALRELAAGVGLTDVTVVLYGFPLGYLLEAVRNLLGRRALRSSTGGGSKADRSAASGRWYQPSARVGRVIELATLPARRLQRRFPDRGTGLVMTGRRPS